MGSSPCLLLWKYICIQTLYKSVNSPSVQTICVTQKLQTAQYYNICKGSSERGERMRALGVWVTAALPSHQSTSTRAGCQLEATYMTHLTPPLEPWLEIIGLFLQLNRWHTVPGWMSASLYTYYSQHICARCLPHLFSSYVLESKMSALCFLHRKIQAAHRQRLSCPMLFFFFLPMTSN